MEKCHFFWSDKCKVLGEDCERGKKLALGIGGILGHPSSEVELATYSILACGQRQH